MYLLTDYGLTDELAGVLRAAVARHAPGAHLIDLTHGVPAFDVRAGALALERSVPHLGSGVVVAVVDPGVAGERRGVALEVAADHGGPRYLVGPDNGLLMWAADVLGGVFEAVELGGAALIGQRRSTFDGRDVFAPAAAALWKGERITALGDLVEQAGLQRLERPLLSVTRGAIETEVLWVDAFGNVQLSATGSDADRAALGDRVQVVIGTTTLPMRMVASFADVGAAEIGAGDVGAAEIGMIVDANGHLALVGDRSSAALTLGLHETDHVTVKAATLGTTLGGGT